ncbi:MAG: hypothetical protein AAF228_10100 [Pseudomonadota bacterium]
MRFTYVFIAACVWAIAGFAFMPSQAQAAQLPVTETPANVLNTLIDKVQYRRCRRVRYRCRERWGRGNRYRRCVRRRDCAAYPRYRRHRYCRRARSRCRDRYGYGRVYRRCVRNRGCRL